MESEKGTDDFDKSENIFMLGFFRASCDFISASCDFINNSLILLISVTIILRLILFVVPSFIQVFIVTFSIPNFLFKLIPIPNPNFQLLRQFYLEFYQQVIELFYGPWFLFFCCTGTWYKLIDWHGTWILNPLFRNQSLCRILHLSPNPIYDRLGHPNLS